MCVIFKPAAWQADLHSRAPAEQVSGSRKLCKYKLEKKCQRETEGPRCRFKYPSMQQGRSWPTTSQTTNQCWCQLLFPVRYSVINFIGLCRKWLMRAEQLQAGIVANLETMFRTCFTFGQHCHCPFFHGSLVLLLLQFSHNRIII